MLFLKELEQEFEYHPKSETSQVIMCCIRGGISLQIFVGN